MLLVMQECGLAVESHHHESASGGQGQLAIHFFSAAVVRPTP